MFGLSINSPCGSSKPPALHFQGWFLLVRASSIVTLVGIRRVRDFLHWPRIGKTQAFAAGSLRWHCLRAINRVVVDLFARDLGRWRVAMM